MYFLTLRRVFWWTIIGLITVVTIGPVIAVVGTVVPFTIIGVLVWFAARGVHRLVVRLRGGAAEKLRLQEVLPQVRRGARLAVEEGIRKCKQVAPVVREGVQVVGRGAAEVLQNGVRHCREAAPAFRERARQVGDRIASRARVVLRVLTEVVSGGLAGALIGWYCFGPAEAIAVASIAGAGLGLLTGTLSGPSARDLAAAD
jgi:hypothetical protein